MSSESGTHLEFVIVTGAVAVDRQRTGTAVWLRSLSMEVWSRGLALEGTK
jgi:hypothetical protein